MKVYAHITGVDDDGNCIVELRRTPTEGALHLGDFVIEGHADGIIAAPVVLSQHRVGPGYKRKISLLDPVGDECDVIQIVYPEERIDDE